MAVKNERKRITKVEKNINVETGEILSENFTELSFSQEPEYVKLYFHDISRLFNLKANTDKTLLALLRKMNYDNEVVLTSKIKEAVAEELRLKKNTIEHSLAELCRNFIFFKVGNNQYLVNPDLFARGNWKNISQIKLQIIYKSDGTRKLKSEFSTQKSLEF